MMEAGAGAFGADRPGGRTLAWDGPTRLFKWTLVALVLDGWVSNAFGGSLPAWHKWNGYAILVLLVFRLLWGFVGGSTARFSAFVPGPSAVLGYLKATVGGQSVKYLGHNPLGALMVLALLAIVTAQCLTGLYAADEDRLIIEGPLAKTVTDATVTWASHWHHRFFTALEALVVFHILANALHQLVKRDPLVSAMVTGEKPAARYVDQTQARPGSWTVAGACLLVSAVIVFGGIVLAGGRIV
jgi:cytochrome b